MNDEFDEFNEFDEVDDLNNDDFSFQDNYFYDEDSSFDSTVNDYEYLDYEYNRINRNEEDNYYDEEEDDDDTTDNKQTNHRKRLVKIILVFIILLLIIWIISLVIQSTNKKVEKSEEVKVIKTNSIDYENMFLKTKNAALKYYTEEEVNDSIDREKTLKLLKSLEYIDIDSNEFDLNQSYVKLVNNNDSNNYNILIVLVSKDEEKTKTYEVSNYSYCIDTYLCEKQNILGMEENQSETEDTNNSINQTEITLSSWSLWSNYEKTSCDTKAITCEKDDTNCLTEIKLSQRKEKVGTYNKVYKTSRFAFSLSSRDSTSVCMNYDYIKIDGTYYRIEKNSHYTVLGAIKKDTQSNYYNWRYDGRKSYMSPPSDNITTRYVYVGPDYSNCTDTCQNNPNYYYDKYTFTNALKITKNPATDCSNPTKRIIANYSIKKQEIKINREEDKYETICYKSYRTREIIKN